MFDRAFKITLVIGVVAAAAAVALSIFHGTFVHWKSGDATSGIEINFGAAHDLPSAVLGTLAVICLLLGGAFLALLKNPSQTQNASSDPKAFSFLTFLQNLKRSKTDCWLGGVCGGLGTHTPVPSWVWRSEEHTSELQS